MSNILFPAGRMIGGSLDKMNPVLGPDGRTPKVSAAGVPEMKCSIGIAIPKGSETHWSQTPWGAEIYKIGAAAHPNIVQSPAFSWKITDGDSPVPNSKGKIPSKQTGYPGNWVIWFSQGWLPKRVNADGSIELPEGSIVPGFYVQMYGSCAGNKPAPNGKAGVYLNPIAVALIGEGDRIATESVDTTTVGFGAAPLPAGARPVVPVEAVFQQPAPAAPVQVAPNPAFLQPAPMAPAAPTAPATPVGPQMIGEGLKFTYAQWIASGWTDAALRSAGYMI
jgi:hypothetical protein